MKLQFLGATRQVTGSQTYVEADGARILVDCGMFQEREHRARNWEPSPVPPKKLDAILLTHAHVDHCGLTPKLVGEGFGGRIITTAASANSSAFIHSRLHLIGRPPSCAFWVPVVGDTIMPPSAPRLRCTPFKSLFCVRLWIVVY